MRRWIFSTHSLRINERRVEAVFRLKRNAGRQVCDFVAAGGCDEVDTMGPAGTPLRLQLVTYAVPEAPYVLGTTLLDAELYPLAGRCQCLECRVERLEWSWLMAHARPDSYSDQLPAFAACAPASGSRRWRRPPQLPGSLGRCPSA